MGLTRIRAEQISDIDYKQAVRVITLTNVTLNGGAPSQVDGVNLQVGNRVLVNGQENATLNGLYVVSILGTGENGTWVRTSDGNQDGEIQPGMVVMVTEGVTYADTPWKLTTNGEIILGVSELRFAENYSLAFGNIFAGGTAVVANTVSAPITFAAGENVSIIGNNVTKTVTISATGGGGGSGSAISNGTSNVTVVSSGGNVTVGIAGDQVAEFGTVGLDVTGNITTGNILTDGYYYANGEPFSGGGGSGTAIVNGTSNVDIATANANITMSVAGTSNVVVVSATGITVQGNVVGNGIPITTVSTTPPANPEQGDIWIENDTGIQYVYFTSSGNSQWAEMEAQVSIGTDAGTVDLSAVAQDIIPAANATYSLGNATNRWANLYLVGNTIDLGGAQIKADAASGAIALIPAPTANVANPTALVISTSGGINVVETAGGELSGNAIGNAAATASPPGAPRITQITVTDGSYDPTGATAVALAGGFVQIVGNGFQSGCQALIGSVTATATGFQSSEILDVEVPAQSAGSYIVYVVNPDGGVGLRPNGITYSGLPTWVTGSTLPSQSSDVAISIQLDATSDSAVTYSLQAGSSLPANVTLSSAGLISGTATVEELTVFSFTILATDAELQASPRTFSLTVTVGVNVEYLVIAGGGGGGSHNAGGGGAGGYRSSVIGESSGGGASAESLLVLDPSTNYTVTVGAGGAGGGANGNGFVGSNSVFSTITSNGGGRGGGTNGSAGGTGGSGGGGSTVTLGGTGGAGTANQGYAGGDGGNAGAGGGGGGAGGAGGAGSGSVGGAGGAGVSSSITGSAVSRAGGGGAAGLSGGSATAGGGAGRQGSSGTGTPGTVNTGGGGGGAGYGNGGLDNTAAQGGSGVVILKYPNTFTLTNPGGGLTFTTSTAVAEYKVTTFTAGTGNIQFS